MRRTYCVAYLWITGRKGADSRPATGHSGVMTQTVLGTPAQIFANIPGLLGFYPEESIIFLNFSATTAGSKVRLSLDFASRADITDWRSIDRACEVIAQHEPDAVWVVLITKDLDPFVVDETVDEVVDKAKDTGIHLAAVWVTPEIASGSPYFLAGCGTNDDGSSVIPDTGVWDKGTICDIATAMSTKQLVDEGSLPELSRADVLARFAHGNPYVSLSSGNQKKLRQKARALISDIQLGESPASVRLQFLSALHMAGKAEKETALLKEKDTLYSVITLMSEKFSRDLVLDLAISLPVEARRLCLAVAKTATGFPRHNALCIYVLASIALEAHSHNFAATEVILKEDPQHVLAQCIGQACMHGIHKELLDACLAGSRELLADLEGDTNDCDENDDADEFEDDDWLEEDDWDEDEDDEVEDHVTGSNSEGESPLTELGKAPQTEDEEPDKDGDVRQAS